MASNVRLNLWRLLLLITVVAFAATVQAASDTEARLVQLERVSSAHSQVLTQLQQQAISNQSEIDLLRGQIQESQYQLSQVIERQKKILLQLDSLSTPASGNETSNNSLSAPSDNSVAESLPAATGDEKSDYGVAVALIHEKNRTSEAMAAFQKFIKAYPKSKLQPNALYWLGQLNYSAAKKDDAIYYFAKVAKDYPKSSKAAESLYKVGVIMQDQGKKTQAKTIYSQVIQQYPNSEGAKLAEKKRKSL